MYSGVFDWPWWAYVVAALALTHVTIVSVTIFLHRHQAHRALELGSVASHFFRFWLWLSTGMITREWAAIHRKHHAKCESVEDPHSPQILGLPRVLFGGVFLYVQESFNVETLTRYGHGTPDDWLERHVYTPWHKFGILLMLLIDVVLFGIGAGGLIWLVQMLWIPFWAAGVINGVGHFWGYRNFACADASKNILPWGILIGGEELHNNHHAFATSAKLSNRWYEFDIGWFYIRILTLLGQAKIKKLAPKPRLGAVRPVVDLDTVQTVIAHRYDVLKRYGVGLKQLYCDELAKLSDAAYFRGLKSCLPFGASVPQELRARFEHLLARSDVLAKAYVMRAELVELWERSHLSREQLVRQLQDWCVRAESSGIRQLQELSVRLRRYVPV